MQIETWNDYVKLANRTARQLPVDEQMDHANMGLITELGELTDIWKRFKIYNKPMDLAHVREEIGDFCWYLALHTQNSGLELELDTEGKAAPAWECLTALARSIGHMTHSMPSRLTLQYMLSMLTRLANELGLDFKQCLRMNVAKLALRFGDKYSDSSALMRDLEAERKLLAGNV